MRPPIEDRDWLTTGEAAAILEVDISTIRDWVDRGHLIATRYPSAAGWRRITKESVDYMRDPRLDQGS
jgi:excisionase family DNA binding protein